jgi:hypothetical protein
LVALIEKSDGGGFVTVNSTSVLWIGPAAPVPVTVIV